MNKIRYVLNCGKNEITALDRFIIDIIDTIRQKIDHDVLNSGPTTDLYPLTLIKMIAVSLIVNLSRPYLIDNLNSTLRMLALDEILSDLNGTITCLWQALETSLADERTSN